MAATSAGVFASSRRSISFWNASFSPPMPGLNPGRATARRGTGFHGSGPYIHAAYAKCSDVGGPVEHRGEQRARAPWGAAPRGGQLARLAQTRRVPPVDA